MEKRTNCRNDYKELRKSLLPEEVHLKSDSICGKILNSKKYQQAKTIFAYYPLGNEVNCLPVIYQALKDGKQVALPKTSANHQMDFYQIKDLSEVETGSYGIMEPKQECLKLEPDENAMVIVPGVVFDRQGNRYGYGGGFYDRYFSRFPKIYRLALAYGMQLSKLELEVLATDVKMNAIVTENEILEIENR